MEPSIALPQLGSSRDRPSFRTAAIALAATLTVVTVVAATFGSSTAARLLPLLPICASLWAAAQLLTSFLLFSQFYVAGRFALAAIAAAYALTGLMTIPYLFLFPHLFTGIPDSFGLLQTSAYLWPIWHVTFPTIVGVTSLIDTDLDHAVVPRRHIVATLRWVIAGVIAITATILIVLIRYRVQLPPLVDIHMHFTPRYAHFVAPAIVIANAFAFTAVMTNARRHSPIQTWIAIALYTAVLDGTINALSPGPFTLAWYVGKLETLATASAVLLVLLYEMSMLYRRLFDVAAIDPLTELQNRRSFGADLEAMMDRKRERTVGLAMLVLDLDHFKNVNDAYGHSAGDVVLRYVADTIRSEIDRPDCLGGRFGGEEFVAVMPCSSRMEARSLGERARRAVSRAPIEIEPGITVNVTTSVGIVYARSLVGLSPADLFRDADRALFAAKNGGRDRTVVVDAANAATLRNPIAKNV